MGGCGEANNGSGTDWAVAVNEKANVKTELHAKTNRGEPKAVSHAHGNYFPGWYLTRGQE